MQSSTEQSASEARTTKRSGWAVFQQWNARLHYYLGLYLLLFVWLFLFTGLLLNHSQWKFAEFWNNRHESAFDRVIAPLGTAHDDLSQARDLMRQLGIRGEIEWTTAASDSRRFDFRASRPGHIFDVKADLLERRASVKEIDLNGWGVIRILHTFTGVRLDDARNKRDWVLTSIWAIAMDAVALGLILMVLSSFFLWWDLPGKRIPGAIALLLGCVCCGLFCLGLRWFS